MSITQRKFSQRIRPPCRSEQRLPLPHAIKRPRSRNFNKLVLLRYAFITLLVSCTLIPFFFPNKPQQEQVQVQVQVRMLEGHCISPEFSSAPWVLDASSCMEENPSPHYRSSFSTTGHDRSCSLCGDEAFYLRELRDKIEAEYKDKCKDLVVYGAALGESYSTWMRDSKYKLGKISFKSIKKHNTCFFQFVSGFSSLVSDEDGMSYKIFSADYTQHLIVVDTEKLPYQNNRRNTKLLKFNPGLLFPWADRVIWQDAKLLRQSSMPIDYMLHFNRTVQHHNTCSSFVGLPIHRSTVANATTMTLQNHCNTLVNVGQTSRPTVSDDISVVFTQCNRYEKQFKNDDTESGKVFSQHPLVDTAFIAYDMRSENCRKFNGDFGCSWLDEVHCYSDRDQIPFPAVLSYSGLKHSPDISEDGSEYRDRIYVDKKTNTPMLHIAKRSCHWYFKSFSRCVAPETEEDSNETKNDVILSSFKKVAVIVAGTMQRFTFESTRRNVLQYLGQKKISADYYVSLTTAKAKAYRSNSGYTDHWQPDPILPDSVFDDYADLEEFMRSEIGKFSSTGIIQIQEKIDIDSEPLLKARRDKALKDYPDEDPDLRFPLFDVRSEEIGVRTANANRNLLRMHLAIQTLWEKVLKWEREEHFKYDYVLFLRDDTFWLDYFRLYNLYEKEGDVFIPACDARNPPMDEAEINDHILLSRRDVAEIFGNYYTTLFQTDVEGCMNQLSDKIKADGRRGCNSEMLLKWVTDTHGVKVTKLGHSEIPMQRTANVRLPNGENFNCFHKFCQSKQLPFIFNGTEYEKMEVCKKVDWKHYLNKEES